MARALSAGATRHSLSTCEWDVAGNCQAPVTREVHARPSAPVTDGSGFAGGAESDLAYHPQPLGVDAWGTTIYVAPKRTVRKTVLINGKGKVPLTVIIHAPCRKCENCLKRRSYHWYMRAKSELALSSRTWFATLTIAPEKLFEAKAQAIVSARAQAVSFEALPESERFTYLLNPLGAELTRFLKRVRANSGARFRYLLVAEKHKSGNPHFHMLVHEWGAPIRERQLSAAWQYGFSQFRLADTENPRAALYLCKYLSKSAEARVRASARYGRGMDTGRAEPRSQSIADAVASLRELPAPPPPPGPPGGGGDCSLSLEETF